MRIHRCRKFPLRLCALYVALTTGIGSILLVCSAASQAREVAVGEVSKEYRLKAAFLYKFLGFIDWENAQTNERRICILGINPFGDTLERLLQTDPVANKTVEVLYLKNSSELSACSLLFISYSERDRLQTIMQLIRRSTIVSVSDIAGFADQGGTIELVVEGEYIKFVINRGGVEGSSVRISAQLLALAKRVIS